METGMATTRPWSDWTAGITFQNNQEVANLKLVVMMAFRALSWLDLSQMGIPSWVTACLPNGYLASGKGPHNSSDKYPMFGTQPSSRWKAILLVMSHWLSQECWLNLRNSPITDSPSLDHTGKREKTANVKREDLKDNMFSQASSEKQSQHSKCFGQRSTTQPRQSPNPCRPSLQPRHR